MARGALVVGHPGHELKVFGWISQYRPRVYVLTDGSGRHGVSRLPSSAALLGGLGAQTDGLFGLLTDREIYRAILDQRISLFLNLLESLNASLIANEITFVAGDAVEGYNPTHDLCRMLVNAAAVMAGRAMGRTISNYQFCLADSEPACPSAGTHDETCLHLRLSDELLHRKIAAAESYAEMKHEVEKALEAHGVEYFRTECMKKVTNPWAGCLERGEPFYERCGEMRVQQGEYESVIRLRQHMTPIMEAIRVRALSQPRRQPAGYLVSA